MRQSVVLASWFLQTPCNCSRNEFQTNSKPTIGELRLHRRSRGRRSSRPCSLPLDAAERMLLCSPTCCLLPSILSQAWSLPPSS